MKIERVTAIDQLPAIWALLYDEYRIKDYIDENEAKKFDEHHTLDIKEALYEKTRTVMITRDDGELVGTAAMSVDGSEGLPTDGTFRDATDKIRAELEPDGKNLGAVWRLAVKDKTDSRIVGSLFDEVRKWIDEAGLYTVLFVVHPHHAKFYQRMIGAAVVCETTGEFGLKHAPAVLLRLDETHFDVWFKHRKSFFHYPIDA